MIDRQPIPNINIGQVYDQRYSDAEVHYDKLGNLAEFFGRNMPVHRHDRFFQVHYVKSGAVRVYLDDQQYLESGPMFFSRRRRWPIPLSPKQTPTGMY